MIFHLYCRPGSVGAPKSFLPLGMCLYIFEREDGLEHNVGVQMITLFQRLSGISIYIFIYCIRKVFGESKGKNLASFISYFGFQSLQGTI